jgi:hypothetical protein
VEVDDEAISRKNPVAITPAFSSSLHGAIFGAGALTNAVFSSW